MRTIDEIFEAWDELLPVLGLARNNPRPRCYNRPPYTGHWAPNGYRNGKRVLRFIRHRMSDDCGAWKAGDGQPSVPESENWNCGGCRWKPEVTHARP